VNLMHLCVWISNTAFATSLRESPVIFPLIESVHVLAIALLVGTVAIMDLRLLGVMMKDEKVSDVVTAVLPLTWCGFAIQIVTGSLLFWAKADVYYDNPLFRIKLLLLLLAGLNPLIFHSLTYRTISEWNEKKSTPWRAKFAGLCSLTLWSGVVVVGRAIAYYK